MSAKTKPVAKPAGKPKDRRSPAQRAGVAPGKNPQPAPGSDAAVEQKGYAGTGDHAAGRVSNDPTQATPQQIKDFEAKNRNT